MAVQDPKIQGELTQVNYNRPQTQYQYFPEEYFTGSDITVYFGDTWVDEITGLSFSLAENVKPLFGYASRTWDDVSRGSRIVQGQFRLAFKEAGYLHLIMNHLGQITKNAKPRLSYLLGGETVPKWIAGVKDNIENTLDRYHGEQEVTTPGSTNITITEDLFEWPTPLKLGDTDATKKNTANRWRNGGYGAISQLQYRLKELGFTWPSKTFKWTKFSKVPLSDSTKKANGYPSDYYMQRRYSDADNIIATASEVSKYNVTNPEEAELQDRLDDYPGLTGLVMGVGTRYDGRYGKRTADGVRKFQKLTGISDGSNGLWVSTVTKTALEQGLAVNGTFDLATKIAVMLFQEKKGLTVDGIVGPATLKALSPTISVKTVTPPTTDTKVVKAGSLAEPKYAQYEKEIWGRSFAPNEAHQNRTYFYDATLENNGGEWLQKHGFDIYITYGPYPENVIKYNGGGATKIDGSPVAFNTTITAIRNVQLTSVSTTIDSDGRPIEEVYTFIAQDLN